MITQGVVLAIDPQDRSQLEAVERDAHGHPRIAQVEFGKISRCAGNGYWLGSPAACQPCQDHVRSKALR